MKSRGAFLLLVLIACCTASGAYTWWRDQYLGTYDSLSWSRYWSTEFTGTLFTSYAAEGGTLTPALGSMPYVPDSTWEISTQLFIGYSGGDFIHYARVVQGVPLLGPTSYGTFYATALQDVIVTGAGASLTCRGNLVIYYSNNGVLTELGRNNGVACRDQMEMRTLVATNNRLYVWLDQSLYGPYYMNSYHPTGGLGIGVRQAVLGNGMRRVRIGPRDTVAPGVIPSTSVISQPWQGSIDLAWQGSADDANGRGFLDYEVYRSGAFMANVKEPGFTDRTVAAGTQYTYTIVARDQHFNTTSVTHTATALVNAAVNPRKLGVRALGTYWGAGGENIDMGSGNLNFTVPVMGAKSRGIAAGLALSYNSQNWREHGTGVFKLGQNTGAGYGWRLGFGSLVPYYQDYWTIHHWTFIDASGAEYRLSLDANGRWVSSEGLYIAYSPSSNKLRFNDGSYWVMGSVSTGGEEDAGARYPTRMVDSNGNTITIWYQAGQGMAGDNTSSRITGVERCEAGAGTDDLQRGMEYGERAADVGEHHGA